MFILESSPHLCVNECFVILEVFVLQDVMNKVRSDTLLDLNLEKSRVKELVRVLSHYSLC